jgi:hypothetical protein
MPFSLTPRFSGVSARSEIILTVLTVSSATLYSPFYPRILTASQKQPEPSQIEIGLLSQLVLNVLWFFRNSLTRLNDQSDKLLSAGL